MTQIVHKEYLEMCRGKSFLLSKVVASGKESVAKQTESPGFKCLRAISDAIMKIELKWGCKYGSG